MSNTGSTSFPTAYDTFENPTTTTLENQSGFSHSALHAQVHDAIEAIETSLGTHSVGTAVFAKRNNETFGTPSITGGTINSVVMGTPNITGGTYSSMTASSGTISSVRINNPTIVDPTVGTLADSVGTIDYNPLDAQIFSLTFGTTAGVRTIGINSGGTVMPDGLLVTLKIKQNASATGTLSFIGGEHAFSSDIGTPTIGNASTWNYYTFRHSLDTEKMHYVGQVKNIS